MASMSPSFAKNGFLVNVLLYDNVGHGLGHGTNGNLPQAKEWLDYGKVLFRAHQCRLSEAEVSCLRVLF